MLRSPFARNLLFLLAAAFFLLRFVHLTADYPRNIRWDDGIATDEGWYASGAINEQTWGTPLLAGDMNIPVLMPLWSLIADAAFHLGGFSVVSLRVTAILFFFLFAGLGCVLLHRFKAGEWTPLFLAMLAMNPWAFAFSRAAFLEFPMLSLCMSSAVLVPARGSQSRIFFVRLMVAGVVFASALLLKTTAIALAPVLGYVLLERSGFHLRNAIRDAVVLFGAAGAVYGAYWIVAVTPRIVDVQFYLSVVKNTLRFTPYGFLADTSRPFRYGLGSDHLLFPFSLVAIVCALFLPRFRLLWKSPVFAFAGVWLVSFLTFMVKHNNDPARYFAVTIPATMFVAIALLSHTAWTGSVASKVLLAAVILDLGINGTQVLTSVLHPRYSFHMATSEIAKTINREDPAAVIIGDEMHEVALHDGLKPVNLLFHSDAITEQMTRYKPGWWLQFSPIDDGRCFREVLNRQYSAERRGEWDIFYPGQTLILWKLHAKPGAISPVLLTASQTAACQPPVYN